MNRKINYRTVGVIVVCFLIVIVTARIYLKNAWKCQIKNIAIHGILEYPGGTMTTDDFLKGYSGDFGLDNDMQKDIRLDPQKYKVVNIKFNISNVCKIMGMSNVGINAKYDSNLSKMVIGKIDTVQPDDTPLLTGFKEGSNLRLMFIVKANNENDEKILQYVQKSDFILEGNITG